MICQTLKCMRFIHKNHVGECVTLENPYFVCDSGLLQLMQSGILAVRF